VAALVAVLQVSCARTRSPVTVDCEELERPNGGYSLMRFTIEDMVPVPAARITLRIYNQGPFSNAPPPGSIKDSSVVTLDESVESGNPVVHTESVKAPPGYEGRRFDALGCIVEHVKFADDSEWP
jgi:hypothetical protein